MKRALTAVAVFAVAALPLAGVSAGEAKKGPLVPITACRAIGMTYEILAGLELEPAVLEKAKALFLDAANVHETWTAHVAPKRTEIWDKVLAAKKAGNKEEEASLRKEVRAIDKALYDGMGKRLAAILAALPDDETRIEAKAEFLYYNLTKDCWATTPVFELDLSAKQMEVLRAMCVEVIKAKPDLPLNHRASVNATSKGIVTEALTKVLSPDQAVEVYKTLTERDKRVWPPEKVPKPEM
jgi:hypothetical protein